MVKRASDYQKKKFNKILKEKKDEDDQVLTHRYNFEKK